MSNTSPDPSPNVYREPPAYPTLCRSEAPKEKAQEARETNIHGDTVHLLILVALKKKGKKKKKRKRKGKKRKTANLEDFLEKPI